ncbi:MAG: glycosyltransferase family 2 protein [Spirochaetes bacterium]|nr:glycosyltransferase family 2 protein [Spirochaetota bacterium]
MKESVNAVIVTYNNRELLKRCIESVLISLDQARVDGTVTVVDNDSRDGTAGMMEKYFRAVRYIRNPENLGLSAALNRGITEMLDSDFTMLLNDDVELFPETVSLLLETVKGFDRVEGAPAALVHPDGSPQWMKLGLLGTAKEHGTKTRFTRFAGTTACLYRTSLFRENGLFDEFYFFFNEDLDFSLRMKRKGARFAFNPGARVVHHQAQGRHKAERSIRPYFYATDYYFYRKNYGILFSAVYLFMALIHIAIHKRRLLKRGEDDKLLLLSEAAGKLKETMRGFRRIVKKASVTSNDRR